MKKRYFIMLLFIMLLALTASACGNGSERESESTEAVPTTSSEPQTEKQGRLYIPEGAEALTTEELEWFHTDFFNQDSDKNMENYFLACYYRSPADINLASIFCTGMQDSASGITEAERAEVAAVGGDDVDSLDLVRTTAAKMDAVLHEYMWASLEETNKAGLDAFVYLEEYDAYYRVGGGVNWDTYTMLEGYRMDDGFIVLLYVPDTCSDESGYALVTLKPSDTDSKTYLFVSNLPYAEDEQKR